MDRGAKAAVVGSFDLFQLSDAYYRDAVSCYKSLRDYESLHGTSDGSLLLSRYDDIKTVGRDQTSNVIAQSALRFDGPTMRLPDSQQ